MIKLDVTDKLAKLSMSPGDVDTATLSADYLVDYLNDSGVCCGILDDALADVVRQVGELQAAVEGVVIAEQIEPQDEMPAPVVRCLDDDQIAAAGDTIAKLGEVIAAVDGKTVRGEAIKASAAPQTTLTAGINTEVLDGRTLKATIYGTVKSSDKDILVVPPVVIEDDRMTAAIDVHPKSSANTPITFDMVWESLQVAGVLHGVSDEKIAASLRSAGETDSPQLQEIVANGSIAVPSVDARIEHFIETDQEIGEQREDGSIDFRERSTIRNVKSGVRICRWIPPIDGQPRMDIYGQSGTAESGRDVDFEAGENVELRNDDFWSLIDGAVMIRKNIVSVSDVYSITGDIDLQSGNLKHTKGTVHIKGTVRSNFEVWAGCHIIVDETVEDATLECGGDVEIVGGVIHAEGGRINAAGNVTVKFAQNARISAGDDIVINGPAMNCDLYAGSRIVVAANKSRLVGGVARASGGFQVRQLGAETGAPTLVEINVDHKAIGTLKLKIKEMQKTIAAGKATQADMERLLETLHTLTDTSDQSASIDIEGIVYPGVTVNLFGVQYRFITERSNCRIHLDGQRKIKVTPLI